MPRSTAKHFKVFKEECEKWLKIYGLQRYRVFYEHDELENCLGGCNTDQPSMQAVIQLGKDWHSNPLNNKEVKIVAFHETTELLLARLHDLATARNSPMEDIHSARHEVIRVLERILYPKY